MNGQLIFLINIFLNNYTNDRMRIGIEVLGRDIFLVFLLVVGAVRVGLGQAIYHSIKISQ